jgi:hypothetical protein
MEVYNYGEIIWTEPTALCSHSRFHFNGLKPVATKWAEHTALLIPSGFIRSTLFKMPYSRFILQRLTKVWGKSVWMIRVPWARCILWRRPIGQCH